MGAALPLLAAVPVLSGVVLLVVLRWPDEDQVSVLYGRCRHRGALMADGGVQGAQLSCHLHGSTYRWADGKNIHYPGADLKRFKAWIEDNAVWVD